MIKIILIPLFFCTLYQKEGTTNNSRVNLISGDLSSVDLKRLDYALDACDYLIEHLTPEGRYEVKERWGPESDLYLYGTTSTLVEAYRITGEKKYLNAAQMLFDRMQRIQLPNGGWTNNLSTSGQEFIVIEQQRLKTWEKEVLAAIGSFTYAVGKYRMVTGDNQYNSMIERAIDHLMETWDAKSGCFIEKSDDRETDLRSHPGSYQAMFLMGLGIWQQWRPELKPVVQKLTETIRHNFESYDQYTMPFMLVLHATLLMKYESHEYCTETIKPKLDMLISNPIFNCRKIIGGYGHRDGYRGIVNTEANIRGSGSVALAMKIFDLTTNTRIYRNTMVYQDLTHWMDSMKAEHGYFEYQTQHNMKRMGRGSPGQFIPCWWIFGTI